MKKLIVAVTLMVAAAAQADVTWSWWMNKQDAKTDLSLGIATKCAAVDSFELALIYCASPVKNGVQCSFPGINDSDADCGLQFSCWFNRGKDPCAQLACVNVAKTSVLDLGFVNFADDSKVQLGLLNFNKNGFLPVFPFINLSKTLFAK